jgi:hypothetical protein
MPFDSFAWGSSRCAIAKPTNVLLAWCRFYRFIEL